MGVAFCLDIWPERHATSLLYSNQHLFRLWLDWVQLLARANLVLHHYGYQHPYFGTSKSVPAFLFGPSAVEYTPYSFIPFTSGNVCCVRSGYQ